MGDKALVPVSPVDGKVAELRKSVDTEQSTAEAPVDTERQAAAVEGPDNTTESDNKMLVV